MTQLNNSSGFINITYDSFIQCIKLNIGDYILSADNKAAIFLLDFINTMNNLTTPDNLNSVFLEFFIKNQTAIQGLVGEYNELQNHLAIKVNQLKALLPPLPVNIKQWVYQRHDLVHDFNIDHLIIAVDCVFHMDGIEIMVWIRKGGINSFDYLASLSPFIKTNYSTADFSNNRLFAVKKENLPVQTPLDEIKNTLTSILENVQGIDPHLSF